MELAAVDAWAEEGVIPEPDARAMPREGVLHRRGGRGAGADDRSRRRGVRRRGRGVDRRGRPLAPLRPHLLRRGRHRAGAAAAEAGEIIVAGARAYRDALVARAREYRDTLCVGRTHGVHAEPTTFGLKLAGSPSRPTAT